MTGSGTYSISELAEKAELTVRAVRYYISLGLLPPPNEMGPSASYGDEHLERLRVIEQLKVGRLSLTEINTTINKLSTEEMAKFLVGAQNLPFDRSLPNEQLSRSVALTRAALQMKSKALSRMTGSYSDEGEPKGETSDSESWVRQAITDGVEIHYRTPMEPEAHQKLLSVISRAKALFNRSDESGGNRSKSRFFHRERNRKQKKK
jgi:DNA-binding transcriptional MerR regulator